MHISDKIALTAVALVLSAGVALPAHAASTMCTDGMMAKTDSMSGDAMAKDTAMAGDAMKKDAMAGDAMAKDTAMAGDAMKKDAMAGDAMAKDIAMAGDAMMMADYTVKPGDSLWTIAADTLCDGNRYHEIVEANADMLGSGMMIHPGEVLHIPGD